MMPISLSGHSIDTCRYCEERKVGCHSTCEKYLSAKEVHKEFKEKELEGRNASYGYGADIVKRESQRKQLRKKKR